MIHAPCPVLQCPNVLLHIWYVFISPTAVKVWKPWSDGLKFQIGKDGPRPTVTVQSNDCLSLLGDCGYLLIIECFDCSKFDVPGNGDQEWYLADKHDVNCQCNAMVNFMMSGGMPSLEVDT